MIFRMKWWGLACAASLSLGVLAGCGGGGSGPSRNSGDDGTGTIAFSSDRDTLNSTPSNLINFEVYTASTTGTITKRLTDDQNATLRPDDTQPSISPNGNRIVWVTTRGNENVNGDTDPEIIVSDISGANQVRLTDNRVADFSPAYGPNGRIAFVRGGTIYTCADRITNTGTENIDLLPVTAGSFPTWSRDGERIIYVGTGGELYSINASGTGTSTQITRDGLQKQEPDVSLNDGRIVYTEINAAGTASGIVAINSDGSGRTVISPANALKGSPSWSPDGQQICYSLQTAVGTVDIYRVNATEGATPTRIITGGQNFDSDWG